MHTPLYRAFSLIPVPMDLMLAQFPAMPGRGWKPLMQLDKAPQGSRPWEGTSGDASVQPLCQHMVQALLPFYVQSLLCPISPCCF